MKWNAQGRAVTACFGLVGLFSVYSFRLVDLQIVKHEEYTTLAAEKHVHKKVIYARRGIIRDAHNEPLADNLPVKTVVADASHMRNPSAVAEAIANQLEMDSSELAEKLKTGKPYIVLKPEVSEEVAERVNATVQAANIRGIYFEQSFVRAYPNGQMLSHVIGYIDHEHKGAMGIERTMQDVLQGADGFRYIEHDRTGKELVPYRGLEKPAKDGCDVTLTIDLELQNIIESELDAAVAEFKPKNATAIMMRPQTGEILAMASRPTFDPNKPGAAAPDQTKNRSVVDMYEPGSTFKIVTTSAVLQEKLVTPDTTVFCENGHFQYAGRTLRDAHPMGVLTVHQVLMKSSNIGVAKLALQLGENRLYEYVRRYGFGEKTGISLSGEIPGLINPPHRWSKLEITRIPMGQSIAVTPLQILRAMACIANDGKLMRPLIVSKVTDPSGREIATFTPEVVRQVVSVDTARKITSALKDVVSKQGTAQKAEVKGFSVAGKTGTAQKIDPRGGYLSGHYVTSFVGFMPADNAKFALLVVLDDPSVVKGEAFGGTVAGPVFARMASRAANYLDLQPTEEIPPTPGIQKKVALSEASTD
ncbi:MAG: penicillin-binding protein 2 [Verrucomicrobia bacterium]|nr:penicillin-binding protein 2 [Verrucomicrobiota bacterium]